MKQIEEDPWLALPQKYPIGTRVQGKVRNLTSFGAFVEIEPGIDGLIHISDMSWTKRVQHPSEVLRKSEDVEVVVLGVDPENKRISLGLKQTQEDPWDQLALQYAPGVESKGKVVRVVEDGLVVDLGNEVEGFVPREQLDIPAEDDVADYIDDDQVLDLQVSEFDAANRRIVNVVTSKLERLSEEKLQARREAAAAAAPVGEDGAEAAPAAESAAPELEDAGAGVDEETVG
jgi:small subunit ribosomal protein S1